MIMNMLLAMYGLPALALGAGALVLRRAKGNDAAEGMSSFMGVVSLVLVFILTSLEVRQAFQGGVLDAATPRGVAADLVERATYPVLWMAAGFLMMVMGRARKVTGYGWRGSCSRWRGWGLWWWWGCWRGIRWWWRTMWGR
jgi:uncharacterized membrane protein